jgi:DNA-binding NtrC family response regulator
MIAAVVDERMPKVSGIDLLSRLKTEKPSVIRILLTAYADFERLATAINAAGIFRFVTKPWRDEEMRQVLHQAAELYALKEENRQLLRRLQNERDTLALQKEFLVSSNAQGFEALVGESPKLKAVIGQARRAVDSPISVLIQEKPARGMK